MGWAAYPVVVVVRDKVSDRNYSKTVIARIIKLHNENGVSYLHEILHSECVLPVLYFPLDVMSLAVYLQIWLP